MTFLHWDEQEMLSDLDDAFAAAVPKRTKFVKFI